MKKEKWPVLPTRGHLWWKEEFYSICSGHDVDETEETCPRCQVGSWYNVWKIRFGKFVYDTNPTFWQKVANKHLNKRNT